MRLWPQSALRAVASLALLSLTACGARGLPDCDAPGHVLRDDLRLDLSVNLSNPDAPTIKERISLRADRDGRALTLFGRRHRLIRADGGVRYDGETATFCTKPFRAGETVTVELETAPPKADYRGFCGGYDRFAFKGAADNGPVAYGPFSEPHCASQWLFVPQSAPEVSSKYDDSPALAHVSLRVTTPNTAWTVLGPNGRGSRFGATTSFEQSGPFPLYALSFAASPRFRVRALGKSRGGVALFAAELGDTQHLAAPVARLANATFEFMEGHLGPYPFGGELVVVTMPEFPGGMEHVGAPWLGVKAEARPEFARQTLTHELVHQWWGNSSRFGDFHDVWLAEAFTEWFTRYRILPSAVSTEESAAAISASRTLAGSTVRPLRPADDATAAQVKLAFLRAYAYGSSFLEMIAVRLIRDFDRKPEVVFRQWYERTRGKAATSRQFEAFLGELTGSPGTWRALFDHWAYSVEPVPMLALSDYRFADGQLDMVLTLTSGAPDLPRLRVAVIVDAAQQLLDAPLSRAAPSVRLRAQLPGAPTRIVIDPDHWYITGTKESVALVPAVAY